MPVTNLSTTYNSSNLSAYFQPVLQRQLVDRISETLRLNELANQVDLPKNAGSTSVKFFQFDAVADASNVLTLTEGVTPNDSRTLGLNSSSVELVQYGEIIQITDKLSFTSLFNVLQEGIKLMGQDAALKADNISRDVIQTGVDVDGASTTAKRYVVRPVGTARTFANLKAATAANSSINTIELLDAVTALKANKSNPLNGKFTALVPPQVSRDLFRDTDFLNTLTLGGQEKGMGSIVKGELGTFYGIRIVEHTNPFIESSAAVTENTFNAAGDIYSTTVLGENAFGVVKLSGDSPMSPKVTVLNGPDKSDILNQVTKAGYKCYYAAKLLNAKRAIVLKSKSNFTAS